MTLIALSFLYIEANHPLAATTVTGPPSAAESAVTRQHQIMMC